MRKPQENICKFVTEGESFPLITVNFVFEKNNTYNGKELVKSAHSIMLVFSGSGTLTLDGNTDLVLPGTIFFIFAGEKYILQGDENFEYIYITFKGARADELFERYGINAVNRIFKGYESLLPFWQSAIARADSANLDLVSESVLLYTFSQMAEIAENGEKHLLGSIIGHIEAYFSDNTLTLGSCAESLGYNPKYISRVFSKNVGMTFSEYLKNVRIKHAIFLMENGVTAIKNVALLSGYSDPLYFSNVFKASTGLTPSDFLKKRHGSNTGTK